MANFRDFSRKNWAPKDNDAHGTFDQINAGSLQRIADAIERQAVAAERQADAAEKQLEETRALNARLTRVFAKYEDVLRSNTSLKGKITTLRTDVNKLKEEKGGARG